MTIRATLTTIYLIAVAVSGFAASLAWRRREVRGARALAAMLLAAAIWALCDAVELQARTIDAKRLISQVQYLGVVSAAPFYFLAAWGLSRPLAPPRRWLLFAVWGIPVATLGVAWTSAWHGALWRDITIASDGSNAGVYHYGWWFWVLTAQHYLLVAAGSILLLGAVRRVTRPFRAPLAVVVLAVLLPWLGNVAYVFKAGPPGFNWLSVSIIASGLLFAWLVTGGGLLDLLPRAREALIDGMTDAVLVLDSGGEVLMANPAARELVLAKGARAVPEPLLHGLPADGGAARFEARLTETERWVEVRSDPIRDRWGGVAGRLLVVRDVTDRKRMEAEREKLLADIEAALDAIRTLQGLLPICMVCHKVRDDQGYWSRLEEYVRDHSAVRFTHGVCPECMVREYGGLLTHGVHRLSDGTEGSGVEPPRQS